MGVAIQNARLYEEARRRASEMAPLAEIGHDIATTVDLEPVLEQIAAQAKQLLRVRDIALYMRDSETQVFPAVVVLGKYIEAIKALPIVVGRGIVGHVAKTSVAEVVSQPESDPRTIRIPGTPLPAEELEGLMCGAAALTRSGDRPAGRLAAARRRRLQPGRSGFLDQRGAPGRDRDRERAAVPGDPPPG